MAARKNPIKRLEPSTTGGGLWVFANYVKWGWKWGEMGWWALTSHFTHLISSLWSSEHQCNNQQDHRCQFCARPCKLSPKFSHRPKLDSRDFARERKIAKSIEKSFAGLLHGGAAAAQWELPPFSGLVKRVTPDFYSTSWTFLNPMSTSSSTTIPSLTTISSSTTTSPFLRLVKCTTLSLHSVSWALLDPHPFRFNKLSTVAKCSLDIFQFANTRNLTKSEMCLELLLYEKAK